MFPWPILAQNKHAFCTCFIHRSGAQVSSDYPTDGGGAVTPTAAIRMNNNLDAVCFEIKRFVGLKFNFGFAVENPIAEVVCNSIEYHWAPLYRVASVGLPLVLCFTYGSYVAGDPTKKGRNIVSSLNTACPHITSFEDLKSVMNCIQPLLYSQQ